MQILLTTILSKSTNNCYTLCQLNRANKYKSTEYILKLDAQLE